jgi:hypothetical protein
MIADEIDGDVVMMSTESGNYYGLDSVGGRIWNLLGKPRKVGDLISDLLREYDVAKDTCENDVLSLLNGMYDENVISLRE